MIAARRRLWASTLLMMIITVWMIHQWPDRGLWYDETVNAYFAERSWADIWQWCTEIDNQMPLDFVLRKMWGIGVGTSEFSLRAFSMICALLSVAGVIALGRRVGGSWIAGALAGLAFALSQGFLYAAFEVRPYALALALFVWSSVVFWEWSEVVFFGVQSKFDRRYWQRLILYLLLVIGLLYTHYTAFLALVVHGVFVAWLWWSHPAVRRRSLIVCAHLAVGFVIGYAPWMVALAGRDVSEGTAYAGEITPGDALQAYTQFYVFGQRIVPPHITPYLWGMLGVLLLSLLAWIFVGAYRYAPLTNKIDPRGVIFALGVMVLPLAGLLVMVYGVQAKLSGRHGWPVWVGASLIIGAGLAALNRGRGHYRRSRLPVWIMALLVIWLPARADLLPVYNSYLREAFAYINHHAEPGDVLILRDGTLFTAAGYYDVSIPWIGFPPDKLTDVNQPLFFDTAIGDLETLVERQRARQVWVLGWQGHIMDPQNLAEGILDALGDPQPLEGVYGFGDVVVLRYALLESPGDLRARVQALNPVLQTPDGGPIFLGGYVLNTGPVPHGGLVQIQTWWQRGEIVMPDMRISVRLYDTAGEFYTQIDQPPVTASFGQEHWRFDVPVLSRFSLLVPPEMPCGPAEVRIILYHMQSAFEPVTVTVDTFEVAD